VWCGKAIERDSLAVGAACAIHGTARFTYLTEASSAVLSCDRKTWLRNAGFEHARPFQAFDQRIRTV
jgi:hypothetical protein